MLKKRARTIAAVVFTTDMLLVSFAFVAAHWLRGALPPAFGLTPGPYPLSEYLPLLPLALLISGVLLLRSGVYRSHRTVPLATELWDLLRICAFIGVGLTLSVFFFRLDNVLLPDDRISRFWILLFAVLSFVFLLAEKITLRLTARYFRSRGLNFRNVVIVGTSKTAAAIADSITRHRYWGYRILGLLSVGDLPADERLAGHEVLGDVARLAEIVDELPVDEVIFAGNHRQIEDYGQLLMSLQELGVATRVALNPLLPVAGDFLVEDLEGIALASLVSGPRGWFQLFAKRTADVLVSLVLILLSLPIMVAVAVAIRLSSGGSVLFRQTRSGLNGRRFTLLKFRTMIEGAESERHALEHLNQMDGPVFKVKNDPRVTRVGRLLRRFSLDELPQLWNVLRGDMSLVGPRPPIPEEVEQYERWQRRRLSMRPGLTCLWQVSGRNEISFDRWMELDLAYIDNWSPLLDVRILLKTIPEVIRGRGAH